MTPLILMVAPNGARRTKDDHPNLPMTPAELAAEAIGSADAGATIIHLHVRDEHGRHSLDPDLYLEALDAVKTAVGERMALQITTEAVGRYTPEQQIAAVRTIEPEAVSLALRELIPDDAAIDQGKDFLFWLYDRRIAPQYILYTPEDVKRFKSLHQKGVIPQKHPWALFVLGRYGQESESKPADLARYLQHHDLAHPWAICAFGRTEAATALTAAGLGGHVRIGFENNLWLRNGDLAPSNAALVAQIRDEAALIDRPIADIEATKTFLAGSAT